MRHLILPLLIGAVYTAQGIFPGIFTCCALWSNDPKWWQFFTNGFLSGNPVHLIISVCGLWFVCSQFAAKVRLSFLLIYFTFFSAASSYLYYRFFMTPHMTLVGASSGVYSLLGFLSWFLRRNRVGLFGTRALSMTLLPFMGVMLILEFFVAQYWIPNLAWRLHLISFGLSISVALLAHAAYVLVQWLTEKKYLFHPLNSAVIRGLRTLHDLKGVAMVSEAFF